MISKNHIVFLLCFISWWSVSAQGFKGGDITIKKIQPYTGNTYSVLVALAIDWPVAINKPYIHINWGDGTATDSIPYSGSTCTLYEATTLKYTGTHTFTPNGIFAISVTDSFYVASVINIPNSSTQKISIHSVYNTSVFNASPVFSICHVDSVPCCMVAYNSGAYDPDYDSLSYALVAPPNINNYVMPPASVDPSTGGISFTNPVSGLVAVTLRVNEWRKSSSNGPYGIIGSTFRELMFKVSASTVGINQNDSFSNHIEVYPNPIKEKLNIQFELTENKKVELTISNSLGQIVYADDLYHVRRKEVDLSFLSSGIYILKLQNNSEQKTFKIVKE